MRAPSGRASATALPTTSTERSVPSIGTSRWRYTEAPRVDTAILTSPAVVRPPRRGGGKPVPSDAPSGDDRPESPAVNALATPTNAAVGPAHDLLLKVTAPRV